MYDRKHIERVLKVNDLTSESPDEEIRSVLLGARYKDDEIMKAMQILRNSAPAEDGEDEKLAQKITRTDKSLTPNEVSKLLGIDIPVNTLLQRQVMSNGKFTGVHAALIVVLALLIASMGIGLAMYASGFGFFHNVATASV